LVKTTLYLPNARLISPTYRLGKNDVYCQAYEYPFEATNTDNGLPPPIEFSVLPPTNTVFPFEFLLPADLPSSYAVQRSSITYSIYANIDISFKLDPSCRVFFNVIQPLASALMMAPSGNALSRGCYQQCCIPPCCCCTFDLTCTDPVGQINLRVSSDRGGYAPGEQICVSAYIDTDFNGVSDPTVIERITDARMELIQTHERRTRNHMDTWVTVAGTSNSAALQEKRDVQFVLTVPPLPPTYRGGLGFDSGWFEKTSRCSCHFPL
jgi:hypothetical protein